MSASSDNAQAVAVAHRLAGLGGLRGAFQILVNAAAQRQAAERRDLKEWTPQGRLPLRRKAAEHLHADNDHAQPSQTTA